MMFREKREIYLISAAILAMFAMFAMFSLIWSQSYLFIMKNYALNSVSTVALAASFSAAGNLLVQVLAAAALLHFLSVMVILAGRKHAGGVESV
ncbi:hypothetical protein [Methermicoccus shengliensis]|uniref:Uncharacterized protein n=1 Tax=Methermicoccus shengliensis TaxID=660064 RepID=A0A832VX06_9EURY|nr:hypothetical protein [Methermicoccus shengliensis]HIH69333.1 hypothetical protein [Methermicoccus shengliensis]